MKENGKVLWPGWETGPIIGRGSFGEVYEIHRDVFGTLEQAALKVIRIPQNASDIDEMYNDGYDEESITSTFKNHLESIVAEYTLMRKMNGSANIVNCDDIRYVQHDNGIGWDIFIKMELLTPLGKALPADISEEQVIRVAMDMCAALELCSQHHIVHRDIKPQNIFVSANGDYKLGDFGIAKTVERTMGGTKIGTYKYMAPEVYNNQPYGTGADIYSLGLVLYWLLNERRMPFLPLPPAKLTMGMEEQARNRRLFGEPLQPPAHGSERLKAIVLKACAYQPANRYANAAEMHADLRALCPQVPAVTDWMDDTDALEDVWVQPPVSVPPVEELDVHQTMRFAYEENPAGKAINVQVGNETVQVWIPAQFENGQTFFYEGMGLKSAHSEKRGDLYLTVNVNPKAVPSQPEPQPKSSESSKIWMILAAAIVIVLIVVGVWKSGSQQNNSHTPGYDTNTSMQQNNTHEHIWTGATCIKPKTCNICGAIEGKALGHDWKEATYHSPKTCKRCGITEGETLHPAPQSLENVVIERYYGKLWTKSRTAYNGSANTPNDVPGCWSDWSIPGHSTGVVRDNRGNQYSFAVFIDGDQSANYYYEIDLEGKYSSFTGVCGCPEKSSAVSSFVYNNAYTKYFEVYGDGKLIYTSPTMRYDFAPQSFNIDVTGVRVLRIQYPATKGPNEIATIYDGVLR